MALQLPGWWIRLVREAAKKGGEDKSATKKRTSAQFDVADIDSDRRRWWLSNRKEEIILHTGFGSEIIKIPSGKLKLKRVSGLLHRYGAAASVRNLTVKLL